MHRIGAYISIYVVGRCFYKISVLMGYIPIFLDVSGRRCIVIGRGDAIEGKIDALLEAGAIVTVVSADANLELASRNRAGVLRHLARDYREGDLHGNVVAYIANASDEAARRAVAEAHRFGILLNVADNREVSSFISPAVVRRGDLQIAISTGGSSPSLAAMIRQRLEGQIGWEYAVLLQILRCARQFLGAHESDTKVRKSILKSLAAALLDSLETLDLATIDRLLRLHLKAGVTELGLELQDNPNPPARCGATPIAET
jgi:siroheme synthase-like protein